MVKAIIDLNERENQILNIVKAKNRLKNKTDAIKLIIKKYEEAIESELRPEYLERLNKIKEGKHHKFHSMENVEYIK